MDARWFWGVSLTVALLVAVTAGLFDPLPLWRAWSLSRTPAVADAIVVWKLFALWKVTVVLALATTGWLLGSQPAQRRT